MIRFNYFLNAYNRSNNKVEKVITLTFDDGPTEFTPRILDILEQNNAKATFFCIGKQIENFPKILIKAHQAGHIIVNNTFNNSHKNVFYSADRIIDEIESTNALIESLINKKTALFRPPFGVTNPHIAKAINSTKHKVIGWSVRSLDTVIEDENKLFLRIKKQIKPGCIVLMHDTSERTANVLEQLFVFLQEENYKVIPLNDLLKIEAYEN